MEYTSLKLIYKNQRMSTCNRLDRLANTRMSTDYAQKSPPSLVDTTETKPLTHFIATIRTPQYSTLSEYIYVEYSNTRLLHSNACHFQQPLSSFQRLSSSPQVHAD